MSLLATCKLSPSKLQRTSRKVLPTVALPFPLCSQLLACQTYGTDGWLCFWGTRAFDRWHMVRCSSCCISSVQPASGQCQPQLVGGHRRSVQPVYVPRAGTIPSDTAGYRDAVLFPVDTVDPFPTELATPRRVDIMLPQSYHTHTTQHYPVLYMHDGQNCINPATSFLGIDWGLDEVAQQLIQAGKIQEFIAVLIWNTPQRLQEYMPAEALRWLMKQEQCWYDRVEEKYYNPTSDAYLSMLVQEIKPWVDNTYRTRTDRSNTVIMGSSMGGLISLYALQQYPEVFGGAACLSTNWIPGRGVPVAWLAAGNIPDPETHRLYFDHGTEGLDAEYGLYQKQVDEILQQAGYKEGVNFKSLLFVGETHDEVAWRKRLHIPLEFLLGNGTDSS